MRKSLTTAIFTSRANNIHNYRYNYAESQYINAHTKISIICPVHGIFFQTPDAHCNQRQGCPICAGKNITTNTFISKCAKLHKNKYDYQCVEYTKMAASVDIICPVHGHFYQIAEYHINGSGCPKCVGKNITNYDFINNSSIVHSHKYNYSLVNYKYLSESVQIVCNQHGVFSQNAGKHLAGAGCPECGDAISAMKRTKSVEQFIVDAKEIHSDTYDYSLIMYQSSHIPVNIICQNHGSFYQTPASHLSGRGCRRCNIYKSKVEKEWLDHLNIINRQIKIKTTRRTFIVDGFLQDTNTIYEFYGDYWHGNPLTQPVHKINVYSGKSMGELYKLTCERENILKEAGYNLITIWESDWKKFKKLLK